MATYTIYGKDISSENLQDYYVSAKRTIGESDSKFDFTDLDYIFEVGVNHRDRFPNINAKGLSTPLAYLELWVRNYVDAMNNVPSTHIAQPKGSCNDPALKLLVKVTQGIDEANATDKEKAHCLFMSAENVQGQLLEEYIYLKTRPYGFLWCAGEVLKAIDFCNTDGSLLLQIKNKSNTENSSSSAIREGTDIQKWYRVGTRTEKGKKYPVYKWDELNILIDNWKRDGEELPPCTMSEPDYQNFLKDVAEKNHNIITDESF